jgi:hypothetical protein
LKETKSDLKNQITIFNNNVQEKEQFINDLKKQKLEEENIVKAFEKETKLNLKSIKVILIFFL